MSTTLTQSQSLLPPSPPSLTISDEFESPEAKAGWEEYHRTVLSNPWIPKEPWPKPIDGIKGFGPFPKQVQFLLHTNTREVFYGGAGGGGKSRAIWYAALQYVHVPQYAALILRRTYADLAKPGALMDLAHGLLAGTGAVWRDRDKRWTFPSGATITFGYLQNENDKYQYAGSEFAFIGFDELTHFTETQYSFLFTRLRRNQRLANVPLRMRSASNPGGVGHDWVFRRFVNDQSRKANRVFIPAKIDDNPALDRDGYRLSLAEADALTRARIEHGDWNAFAGGRFKQEWIKRYTRDGKWWRFGEKVYSVDQIAGRFITVDPAATVKKLAKDDPDFTAISTWGRTPCGLLVWIGCLLVRCEIPEIAGHIWGEYERHQAGIVHIEGQGVGKGAAQLAQRHTGRMNVVEFATTKDKVINATNAMNMVEAGRVWLPANVAAFPLDTVEAQLVQFTGTDGVHDDAVDTLARAANLVMGREPKQAQTVSGSVVARKGMELGGYRGGMQMPPAQPNMRK